MREEARRGGRSLALFGVKAFHSAAFLLIQTAIVYFLYKGVCRESDRKAAYAAAIGVGETLVYVGNGYRCPLTSLAEDLGSEHGAVTDIFLPKWLASNIDKIYGPLLALALYLHGRNLLRQRGAAAPV